MDEGRSDQDTCSEMSREEQKSMRDREVRETASDDRKGAC